MRYRRMILGVLLCSALVMTGGVRALAADSMPDKAKLSANTMRFDSKTGDFLADGNVAITLTGAQSGTANKLTLTAPRGNGNVERRELFFKDGVAASGDWMGDDVSLSAGSVALTFDGAPLCRMQGGVRGSVGPMRLDADRFSIAGAGGLASPRAGDSRTKFWLVKARRVEDRSMGVAFGAEKVEGIIKGGEITSMTAENGVWLEGRPRQTGDPVSIKGARAIYSEDRGSIVMSGGVTAVQNGRTLKSESVVYFPDQNRVEALGGATRKGGSTVTERAEITIDLSRERKRKQK